MKRSLGNFVDPLFSALAEPAYLLDREGKVLKANGLALLTFPQVTADSPFHDLAEALHWDQGDDSFAACVKTGKSLFRVLKNERGHGEFEVNCVALPGEGKESEMVLVTVVNVTGEAMMDERYRILSRVFDSIQEGVLTLDLSGRVTGMNKSLEQLLHMQEADLKRKPLEQIFCFKHARDRHLFQSAFEAQRRIELLCELSLSSGKELPCTLSLAPLEEAGGLVGFVITMRDRTDQLEMERNLIQMEKLNSLGKLVAGFAHELNNPLTSVIGFSQILLSNLMDDTHRIEISTIHNHALRCKKIIDNLLAFARKHKPVKELSDVNTAVRSTLELLGYFLERQHIKVRVELAESLPFVLADMTQLQQVLVNLIDNACYELGRTGEEGVITIASSIEEGQVQVRVADDGPGIPENHLHKIFDPFYTTKPVGEGTGLGLSLSFGIMQEHSGSLQVRNLPEGGAEFRIALPPEEKVRTEEEGFQTLIHGTAPPPVGVHRKP